MIKTQNINIIGVGVGMVAVSAMVAIYYNMIIGWSLYYLFASFTSELPWEKCDPEWATDSMYTVFVLYMEFLLTLILSEPKMISLCHQYILSEPKVISLSHQYRARPSCTSMQSDQAVYCWLTIF